VRTNERGIKEAEERGRGGRRRGRRREKREERERREGGGRREKRESRAGDSRDACRHPRRRLELRLVSSRRRVCVRRRPVSVCKAYAGKCTNSLRPRTRAVEGLVH
jgi:hypothetical protein